MNGVVAVVTVGRRDTAVRLAGVITVIIRTQHRGTGGVPVAVLIRISEARIAAITVLVDTINNNLWGTWIDARLSVVAVDLIAGHSLARIITVCIIRHHQRRARARNTVAIAVGVAHLHAVTVAVDAVGRDLLRTRVHHVTAIIAVAHGVTELCFTRVCTVRVV